MHMVTTNCPACGGVYGGRVTSRFITCEYCGTRYALSNDELKRIGFTDADGDGYDDDDQLPDKYEEDISTDPLPVFARDVCAEFLDDHVGGSSFNSSRKILRGLDADGEEIYLIHDDTMFKTGKNGFAITRSGIYCREMGDKSAHFVSWEKFTQSKCPKLIDSYIRQSGTSICYFTDSEHVRDDLLDLFVRLWRHAQRV
ncbi:MAG: hypothetical protein IKF14_07720 [Atopobiaceae bacterium]|nr:hypothetical protein [Atopobiaceae bacterium]